jgi:hypothetical protein
MQFFRYVEQLAQLALLVSLLLRGLAPRYPIFTVYLGVRVIRGLSVLPLDYHAIAYAKAWALTEPVLLVLQVLVVLELTSLISECYPSFGHLAKVIIGVSLGLGVLIGGSVVLVEIGVTRHQPLWLRIIMGAWKSSNVACASALMLQSIWRIVFPMPMRRNVGIHHCILTFFIGIVPGSAAFFVRLKNVSSADNAALLQVLTEILCCLLWVLLLQRSGEYIRYRPDWIASRARLERVQEQYELIIEGMLRKLSIGSVFGEQDT